MTSNKNKYRGILLLLIVGLVLIFAITPSRNISQSVAHNAAQEAQKVAQKQVQNVTQNTQRHKTISSTVKSQTVTQPFALQAAGKLTAYLASRQQAIVGLYGGRETDNPADNILTVSIDKELLPTDRVWLNYRLTGVNDHGAVACSVNDRLAFGGYLVKTDTAQHRQRVQINAAWLRKGDNRIQFGLAANANYGYKVSDLAIEVETNAMMPNDLVINASRNRYNGKTYVHGFITGSSKAKLKIKGENISLRDGEFEYLGTADTTLTITATFGKQELTRTLRLAQNLTPDHVFALNSDVETGNTTFRKNKSNTLETALALLKAPAKVTLNTLKISSTSLRPIDLPAMDMGMTNVTSENRGVRFLPHGEHFGGEGATVALKYDRTKIPDGYTENDIRSYYFDTNTNHWVALERDTVNKELCMVVSKTTHFTDMINGVIKTPESPETQGFAPTMMNDIKAADPTAKIEMIAPPTANNSGSANLSYPIELAPFPSPIVPNLTIQYNSDGGSGWLGEGWDLNIPTISVDTRWGVPRYDPNYETETYLMNGQMLAMMVADKDVNNDSATVALSHRNGVLYDRKDTLRFNPRLESGFSEIARIKENNEYYWRVRDSKGVIYIYKTCLKGSVSSFADKDVNGNKTKTPTTINKVIAEWKLTEVTDPNGYWCKYYYDNDSKALYLKSIKLGRKDGTENFWFQKVDFVSSTEKTKKLSNGRYGFLTGNNKLLSSISISNLKYGDSTLIRKYVFNYNDGDFGTNLLKNISQFDGRNSEIATHNFDYNAAPVNTKLFQEVVGKNIQSADDSNEAAISKSKSNEKGFSYYAGVGFMCFEVGYGHTRNDSESEGIETMIDINGDGLADKVYKSSNKLCFKPNIGGFAFGQSIQLIGAPSNYEYSESKSISDGWKGAVQITSGIGVNAGQDWSRTTSKTYSYFSDINNDGLVDIVSDGVVYFNYINSYQGANNSIAVPSFSKSSVYTQNPISTSMAKRKTTQKISAEPAPEKDDVGTINSGNVQTDWSLVVEKPKPLTAEDSAMYASIPMQDVVRVWEAPYKGRIRISGNMTYANNKDYGPKKDEDGVICIIQHDSLEINKIYLDKNSQSVNLYTNYEIDVEEGNKIYFRVKAGELLQSNSINDIVRLNPKIDYQTVYIDSTEIVVDYFNNIDMIDEIGLQRYSYNSSEDFLVNQIGENTLETKQQVKLGGTFYKPRTINDITLNIYLSNNDSLARDSIVYVTKVDSATNISFVDSTQYIVYTIKYANPNYHKKKFIGYIVKKKYESGILSLTDEINENIESYNGINNYWFEISAPTNERWELIKCKPELYYSNEVEDVQGLPIIIQDTLYAGVKYNIYDKVIQKGKDVFVNLPYNKEYKIKYTAGRYLPKGCDVTFVLYRKDLSLVYPDREVYRETLKLDAYNSNEIISNFSMFDLDLQAYYYVKCYIDDDYELDKKYIYYEDISQIYDFDVSVYEVGEYYDRLGLSESNLVLQFKPTIVARKSESEIDDMGINWRGWGQFQYNAANDRYKEKMDVTKLKVPDDKSKTKFNEITMFKMEPENKFKNYWEGLSKNIIINGGIISVGRIAGGADPNFTYQTISGTATMPVEGSATSTVQQSSRRRVRAVNEPEGNEYTYQKDSAILNEVTPIVDPLFRKIADINVDEYGIKDAPILVTKSESKSTYGGASVNFGDDNAFGISGSLSGSKGSSYTSSAYMDMNGDGYPDRINENNIEYSNVFGGSDAENSSDFKSQATKSTSNSVGISGEYSHSVGKLDSKFALSRIAAKFSTSLTFTAGGSFAWNNDNTTVAYMDMNGDGLPDRVEYVNENTFKVSLNLGYGFATATNWTLNAVNKNHAKTIGINAGVGIGAGGAVSSLVDMMKSFKEELGKLKDATKFSGGGVNFSLNGARTINTNFYSLRDINGDGLVDQLYIDKDKNLYCGFNLGDRFDDVHHSLGIKINESNKSESYGLSISASLKVRIWLLKLSLSGSLSASMTNSSTAADFNDVDGDGYPDLIKDYGATIMRSNLAYTNKLVSVTNPLGGVINIGYGRSKPTHDHPTGKIVMDTVMINDGVSDDGDNVKSVFEYQGGKYDRTEREFLGFQKVYTKTVDQNNSIYRIQEQQYDALNYYLRNNVLKTILYRADNSKVVEEAFDYYVYSVSKITNKDSGVKGRYLITDLKTKNALTKTKQFIVYSPQKYSKKTQYESNGSLVASETLSDYCITGGRHGEIRTFKSSEKGNLLSDTASYDYRAVIEYKNTASPTANYIFGLPQRITLYDKNNIMYRRRQSIWDVNKARITDVAVFNSVGDTALTSLQYDKYGNIWKKILPPNSNGKRMQFKIEYDDVYHAYPKQITDTFGYTYQMLDYDYRFGIPLKTIDINGNVITQTVDNRGRIETIKGPNEQGTADYTIKFEYSPQKIEKSGDSYSKMPYAITKHWDAIQPDDKNLETVTFVDGFGRPIQVKKESVVNGESKMIASGRAKYDAFGRVKEAYYPVVDELAKTTFNPAFGVPAENILPTRTTYDVLDRVLTTTMPDNAMTTNAYSIAEGKLLTRVTDANGKYQDTYTTGDGKTVKTVQYKTFTGPTGSDPLTTLFEYDAINQLEKVTDAANKTTVSVYDLAGRRTQVTHPASGITTFKYDAAGNLTEKLTANLKNASAQPIKYQYDFNRLKEINYPLHPENDVKYVYGTKDEAGAANGYRAGRLKSLEDGSGMQEYKYGKQGEVTELRRTLVIPNQAVATYVTKTDYDSWNRLLSMTYPDNEVVSYGYNTGGLLTNVKSSVNNYNYVENVLYDKFEQRTYLKYGNGKETNYTYKPTNRQLDRLTVGVGTNYIMNNAYGYDAVGNVLTIVNTGGEQTAANTVSGKIGGKINHTYTYDNLYRLETAHGEFSQGTNGGTASYTLNMEYDNMHNITKKKQDITQTGIQFAGTLKAGYDLNYTINAANSQQISNIADNSYRTEGTGANAPTAKRSDYSYDANGNLIYTATGAVTNNQLQATKTRKLLWDEENRLLGVSDNGFVSQYWYDAAGERTVKESFDNEGVYVNGALSGARTGTSKFTAYVSPYMVVSQGGNYTKHVYMGSQRITSKVSNSGIFTASPVTTTDQQAKLALQTANIKERFDSLGVTYKGTAQTGGLVSASPAITADSYFYHSDHLGSSSLITNKDGYLVQHIQYVPFGEVFVEERNATWSTPYKFNGKEQDEETGLCYYGARYYDPRTSVWLSVDPLAGKYPNISSYVYCADNPVKYIDPDGRKLQIANLESFGVLLSSLPQGARSLIQQDKNGYIQSGSVEIALAKFSDSGNLQALKTIVDDNRTAVFDATKTSYNYIDAETGKTEPYIFKEPRSNDYDDLLSIFQGTPAEKKMYAEHLKKKNIGNSDVSGNLGATLRPNDQQQPFPGGSESTTNNFEIYVSPVGTTKIQKAKNVGHELFGHLFMFITNKDPRHRAGNPQLEKQIDSREQESERNSQQ